MKKKIGLLGCWVCLVCSFTSCNSDNELPGSIGGIKRGDHYLSIQLKTGSASLSARATGLFDGTKNERAVSSVHMLLYDAKGENGRLLYHIPINAKTDGENSFSGQDVANGNQSQFVSKPISLGKQDYQLVVLVNPSGKILTEKARSEEEYGVACNTLKDLLNAVPDASIEEFYEAETNFFMCNAGGIIYISKDELAEKSEDALQNPVSVPVERLLAKLSLHKDFAQNEVKLGGKIGAITWGVDVTNKYTYLMRQPDYLISGNQETGFHVNREEVYAKDPNFDSNDQFINDEEKRKKQFKILSITDNKSFISCNHSKNDHSYYQYALENTMSRTDQNNDKTDPKTYTTQLIIKIEITEPAGMKGVNSYYSFYDEFETDKTKQWKLFTHAQAVEWFNGTFPSDMESLKDILSKAQNMENSPFNFKKGEDKEPAEYMTTLFKLTYHKDGLNVYRVPVEHFGTNDTNKPAGDYGYYGVVRNNVYQIVIKSINGPGINSSDESYLSTTISLNPWFGRDWEEDLRPGND